MPPNANSGSKKPPGTPGGFFVCARNPNPEVPMASQTPRPCERCGTMIPAERVEALPDTRLCVACSRAVGGEFQISFVAENLAKAGSLKKNYGAISMKKTRKPVRRGDGR